MPRVALGRGEEFDRIRAILADTVVAPPGSEVWIGPGDDAAVLSNGIVLSTDVCVEGVHFRLDWMSAVEAGFRAAAGGLSDLAAMAAEPIGILVSVAAPGDGSAALELMEGVKSLAREVDAPLLGGDLARSPGPCFIDVVSVGRTRQPLLRSAAREGDELWVTGKLGGAAAAVALLRAQRPLPDELRRRLVAPTPRLAEARWLTDAGARCGLDLSDGLVGDAGHLAAASGVRVVLEGGAIPVEAPIALPAATGTTSPLQLALHGGEDYELLVTAPPGSIGPRVEEFAARFDLPLTRVGRITEGTGVFLLAEGSGEPRPVTEGGYDHFAEDQES